jgi:probable rRNA maturation factor
MAIRVLVQFQNKPATADTRVLTHLTQCVVKEALALAQAPTKAEVSVLFVDDAEMRLLNAHYRQIDKPTDVLAFSLREAGEQPPTEDANEPEPLGDIVVSLDTAARQAEEHEHSLRHEIAVLLTHGTLHLVGHDHHVDRAQTQAMRKLEAAAVKVLLAKGVL